MIIGLAGYKGSGKDTVAAYLVKQHGFERKAYADPMKRSIAALFDIPFADIDKLKNELTIGVAVGYQDQYNSVQPRYRSMTFRELLQRYGTEAHRDIFDQDFWLEYTLPSNGFYSGRLIVVTDVRFWNEANRIRSLGGLMWYIHRDTDSSDDPHASEEIDFMTDRTIQNHGTLDELYENIEEALSTVIV